MDIEVSKVGERGQVVIPQNFREKLHLSKGEKLLVVRSDSRIILQQMSRLKSEVIEQLHEDLVDLKIAEDRLKELEGDKPASQTSEEFLSEMEKWVME